MKFKSVSLKNYMSYGDNEISFSFEDKGTNIITGQNGVGKSTFFNAIIWGLYGRSSISVDEVVNRYTKKNCKVGVNFEILGQDYTVYRYRKHDTHGNNLYLFKGDENISLKKIADTEQLIQDIIQIPYQAMVSSIIFSCENYVSFLRAKSSERLKILESVLFLREINEYYNITRDFMKDVDKSLDDASHEIEKVEYAKDALEKGIKDYKNQAIKTLEEFKKEKEEKELKIQEIQNKSKELSSIDIQAELDKIKDYKTIIEHNRNINDQINTLKKSVTPGLTERLAVSKNSLFSLMSVKVEDELLTIKNNKEIEKKNSEIEHKIELLETETECWDFDIEIKSFNKQLEDSIKEVSEAEKNICPTCHQPIDGELHKDVHSDFINKRDLIRKKLDEIIASKSKSELLNNKINEDIKDLKLKLLPLTLTKYTEDQLLNIKDRINALQNEISVLENKVENENTTISNIKELLDKIKDIPESSKYTEEQLVNVNGFQEEIAQFEKEIEIINEKAKTVLDKKYIEDVLSKINKLDKIKEKTSVKKEDILSEKKYFSILMDIFSNKEEGFKKFFIDKIIVMFNNNINCYLPIFFEKEITITFDKDLNEKIKYDGFDVSFESFSSGQKTRIDLSIAFSLFFLAKTFFSTTINLICLDEVIDINLDAIGFDAVNSIIENLSQEHAVYIISHRDEYKEKFNNHIQVYIEDGFSSVRRK